ncbi:MAG: BolA/IbaG family iron-sulfur metabolism protein [Bdellovibrionales bacterium]
MMNLDNMKERLETRFPDAEVKLADMTGGGDHIMLEISAKEFEGMPKIRQHQAVMAVFDEELKSGKLHALSIQSKAI